MPHFSLKLHHWRPERIIGRDFDVDVVGTALVRSVWRSWERAAEMCDILLVADGLDLDLRILVFVDVGKFFANSAHAIASHIDLLYALKRTGSYEIEGRGSKVRCFQP